MLRSASLLLASFALLAGCTTSAPSTEPVDDTSRAVTCGGPAMMQDTSYLAWRAELVEDDAGFALELSWEAAHEGGDIQIVPDPVTHELAPDGVWDAVTIELDWAAGQLALAPAAGLDGVWTGTLEHDGASSALTCWADDWSAPFRYQPASGQCEDDSGSVGLNALPLALVRDTGNGHCADLAGQDLLEGNLGYPEWRGFDLRGADVSGGSLFFANIYEARLQGAQLASIEYGYAWITGERDAFTQLPQEGGCEDSPDAVSCVR